jgi:hypothetical protein
MKSFFLGFAIILGVGAFMGLLQGLFLMAERRPLRHTWFTRPFRLARVSLRRGWRWGKKSVCYLWRWYIVRPAIAALPVCVLCLRALLKALGVCVLGVLIFAWPVLLFVYSPPFALGVTAGGALLGLFFMPLLYREYRAAGHEWPVLRATRAVPVGALMAHYIVFMGVLCSLP